MFKPHVVCVPFPTQGHINPMFKLALLLHHKGFHITFVNTEFNQRRLLRSRGPNSLDALPDFRFETIPDGLPPSEQLDNITQDIPSLIHSTRYNCLSPFRDLLQKLSISSVVPPVRCVISDSVMTFSIIAAEEIGVSSAIFRTSTARCFILNRYYRSLIEKGFLPLKDVSYITNGYLDTLIDWIPGVKSMRLKDFPSFIRSTKTKDPILEFIIEETDRASRASAIIFNTFDALEQDELNVLSSMYTRVYSIGPLHSLLNQLIPDNTKLKSIGSNLWKEETECLQWLDTKEAKSVLYVNYGSITVMSLQQLLEFAWGIAKSKHNFLWVIRSDLVVGENEIVLPHEFLEETRDRGLIAEWCPQEQVLDHPAVGGFLTHCGWNSLIESIASGVPMLFWPFFADQPTNCRQACTEWGVGMEIIGNDVKRDEVEKLVRMLMDGNVGNEIRNAATEWKKKAHLASGLQGSSSLNFDRLVELLLSQPSSHHL